MSVVRHRSRLPREAVGAPALAAITASLDKALTSLIQWEVPLPRAGDLDQMVFKIQSNPISFYDSIIRHGSGQSPVLLVHFTPIMSQPGVAQPSFLLGGNKQLQTMQHWKIQRLKCFCSELQLPGTKLLQIIKFFLCTACFLQLKAICILL